MDLSSLGNTINSSLTNTTTGVPGLVNSLSGLFALMIGVRLFTKLAKKFAR